MSEINDFGLICPKCESSEVYYENKNTGSGQYTCQDCEFMGSEGDFNYSVPVKDYKDLRAKMENANTALEKINGIRNSIVGMQKINWSEHIYPLVAALNEAGLKGMGYPKAMPYFGTLIERTKSAEQERDNLQLALESLTPGGSEFHNNPKMCVDYIKNRLDCVKRKVKLRKDAQAQVGVLREALERAKNIMMFHATRCPMNIPNNFSGSEEHLAEYRALYQSVIPDTISTTSAAGICSSCDQKCKFDTEDEEYCNAYLPKDAIVFSDTAEEIEARFEDEPAYSQKQWDELTTRTENAEAKTKLLSGMALPLYEKLKEIPAILLTENERLLYAVVQAIATEAQNK